jgi:hypothetical protein
MLLLLELCGLIACVMLAIRAMHLFEDDLLNVSFNTP